MESSRNGEEYELIGEVVSIYCRGSVWYANYMWQGKQCRRSLKTTSKKQARCLAIRLEAEILEGRHKQQTAAPAIMNVIDAYEAYLIAEGRAKTTLAKFKLVTKNMLALAEQRGAKDVLAIDLAFIDAYVQERKFKSDKTRQHHLVLIKQVVNFALSRKLISVDPLAGLKIKKAKPQPQPHWTRQEVNQILALASGPHRSALALLAETGMRFGELQWLTWEDVDLAHDALLVQPKDGWKPKTGDQRVVPIFPNARPVLEGLPRKAKWVVTAPPSAQYPRGDHQISERRLLQYLKRVLSELGLKGHLHTFRHSFISHALVNRTPEAIVRRWCGQIDSETIKIYTHIADSISQAEVQRLAEINKQLHQQQEAHHGQGKDADSAQTQHTEEEKKSA